MNLSYTRRRILIGTFTAGLGLAALPAHAQETPIKFQLDWRFEGPAAMFLVPLAKGYFKAEKLDVTVDAGNGSGGAVTRVASGTYDMGFADLAALMEFHANNPDAPNKPVAVMMVYNNTPAAVLALKKSGIRTPADLSGKRLGAPVFDATGKAVAGVAVCINKAMLGADRGERHREAALRVARALSKRLGGEVPAPALTAAARQRKVGGRS